MIAGRSDEAAEGRRQTPSRAASCKCEESGFLWEADQVGDPDQKLGLAKR